MLKGSLNKERPRVGPTNVQKMFGLCLQTAGVRLTQLAQKIAISENDYRDGRYRATGIQFAVIFCQQSGGNQRRGTACQRWAPS